MSFTSLATSPTIFLIVASILSFLGVLLVMLLVMYLLVVVLLSLLMVVLLLLVVVAPPITSITNGVPRGLQVREEKSPAATAAATAFTIDIDRTILVSLANEGVGVVLVRTVVPGSLSLGAIGIVDEALATAVLVVLEEVLVLEFEAVVGNATKAEGESVVDIFRRSWIELEGAESRGRDGGQSERLVDIVSSCRCRGTGGKDDIKDVSSIDDTAGWGGNDKAKSNNGNEQCPHR